MKKLYFLLNEYIKSYHIFARFDPVKAAQYLAKINKIRLRIAVMAMQRQIFVEQLEVNANVSGYKNDVFFSHDDIDSLVIKMIAFLETDVSISLTQQGTRKVLFTRESVAWQQLMSQTQDVLNLGQKIPFDFNQEIYLQRSETLDIGITNQTSAGMIFVHGANLKDDPLHSTQDLIREINLIESDGTPNLPKPQLVPIQFEFPLGVLDTPATAVNGGRAIYSIKSDRSVILTECSITTPDCRLTLLDKGRDMEICNEIEAMGIAGRQDNQFCVWYPLPYPHLLRAYDRLQMRALNGSAITALVVDADTVETICFRGFTL